MIRRMFTVGAFLAALTLTPLAFAPQAPADAEGKMVADAYMQAWAKGDAKAIAARYTENGVRAGSDGQLYRGRQSIEQGFVKLFAGPFKGSKLTLRNEHDEVDPQSPRMMSRHCPLRICVRRGDGDGFPRKS